MLAIATTTATTAARTAPADPSTETAAASTRASRHRCTPRDDDTSPGGTEAPQRRGNPLVSAMMSALGALLPASQSDAQRSDELQDSAAAFAHELFDALRGSGERGRARGHEHHHRRHGEGRGYDDLAQRLDRLASQVDTPAAGTVTSTTTISASLSTASFSASLDGGSASADLSVATLQIDITQQTTTNAAAADDSRLQSAFRKLFDALQAGSSTTAAAAGGDAGASAGGLSSFLRQLAGALRNGSGSDDHTTGPTTGSLLSLAA